MLALPLLIVRILPRLRLMILLLTMLILRGVPFR